MSEERKSTPAVALAAIKASILSPFELPESLLPSKEFMLQVAMLCHDTWDNLVPELRSEPEFVHAIVECSATDAPTKRIVEESLKACPSVCSEAAFWIKLANMKTHVSSHRMGIW